MRQGFFATAALALGTVLASGCSTLEVNTDYAPGTDFGKYKTFTIKRGTAATSSSSPTSRAAPHRPAGPPPHTPLAARRSPSPCLRACSREPVRNPSGTRPGT